MLRFHTPLIEPDRRISRIRLSDKACVIWIFPLRRQRRLAHGGAGRGSGVSQPVSGVDRLSPISGLSSPSALGLELRPLPSTGVTRRPRYYEPLRHPRRPGLSLTGVRLRVTRPHRLGFPVLHWTPCADMPSSLPRWPAGSDRSWDGLFQPFPCSPAAAAFPAKLPGRRPHWSFRGLRDVHLRYGLPARRMARSHAFLSKTPTVSLPPPPLR
jgi:hypothetical protein